MTNANSEVLKVTVIFNNSKVGDSFEVAIASNKNVADLRESIASSPHSNGLQAKNATLHTALFPYPDGFTSRKGLERDIVSLDALKYTTQLVDDTEVLAQTFESGTDGGETDMLFVVIRV